MKIIEIIHVRLVGQDLAAIVEEVRASVRPEARAGSIRFYGRTGLVAELAIHITHSNQIESKMGIQLAAGLEKFGLVNRTVWEEL
jgi:hypothetical protein